MNLNSKERQVLTDSLRQVVDHDLLCDEDIVEAIALIGRIEAAEKDSWRPLAELPPLGLPIVIERADEARFRHTMVRRELAKSYSPEVITLHDYYTGESHEFNTKHFYWRLKNA